MSFDSVEARAIALAVAAPASTSPPASQTEGHTTTSKAPATPTTAEIAPLLDISSPTAVALKQGSPRLNPNPMFTAARIIIIECDVRLQRLLADAIEALMIRVDVITSGG